MPSNNQDKQNIRTVDGKTPSVGKDCFIDFFACVSGDVILGDQVSIWPFVSIRGDLLPIKIGSRSNIQDGSVLHTTHESRFFEGSSLNIGDDVTIGHGVICHGCTIKNKVLIGMGSIILDRVIIDDEVIVGAGSLVPPGKHLESGYLYVGSPVKQVRALTDQEKEFLKYSAENYVQLSRKHTE